MIRFVNHERISKPVTNFNDIIKYILQYILHSKTAGFICDTQLEADMLNYIIKNESYGEVKKPRIYWWANDWWANDEGEYINEKDIDS